MYAYVFLEVTILGEPLTTVVTPERLLTWGRERRVREGEGREGKGEVKERKDRRDGIVR